MKNAKEYKRRVEIAKQESHIFYDVFNRYYGNTDRENLNNLIKANRKLVKNDCRYSEVPNCGYRAVRRHEIVGSKNNNYLYSYNTNVCIIIDEYDSETLEFKTCFIKTWEGYSKTTLKHINEFRALYCLPPINKYDWIMMDANKIYK